MDIEYKCKYCGKICKNANSLRNHERLCKLNPNHQEHTGFKYGWTKGLTKETNDGLKHISESLKVRYHKEFVPYYCECCGKLVKENYGSGRFCCEKCARIFSTKEKRKEINKKVSLTLRAKNTLNKNSIKIEKNFNKYSTKVCPICGKKYKGKNKTCSKECGHVYRIRYNPIKEETRKKLSDAVQKRMAEGKHKGWMTRNITSYAERFFKKVLESNNIEYEFNKPICKNDLGVNENGNYFLDFALNNKIDLEIDGKQHKLEERHQHDLVRDERLTKNGWKVYRIEWKSLPKYKDYMKKEIDKFLKWYDENKNSRSGC